MVPFVQAEGRLDDARFRDTDESGEEAALEMREVQHQVEVYMHDVCDDDEDPLPPDGKEKPQNAVRPRLLLRMPNILRLRRGYDENLGGWVGGEDVPLSQVNLPDEPEVHLNAAAYDGDNEETEEDEIDHTGDDEGDDAIDAVLPTDDDASANEEDDAFLPAADAQHFHQIDELTDGDTLGNPHHKNNIDDDATTQRVKLSDVLEQAIDDDPDGADEYTNEDDDDIADDDNNVDDDVPLLPSDMNPFL